MNRPQEREPRRARVQGDGLWNLATGHPAREADARPAGSVDWWEHEEAWRGYARKYGRDQSAERINERGGFCFRELTEFLGHEPTTWRPHPQFRERWERERRTEDVDVTDIDKPEYTRAEVIEKLESWSAGRPILSVETALSALYWLEAAHSDEAGFRNTVEALRVWMRDDRPKVPDELLEDALYWLRKTEGHEARRLDRQRERKESRYDRVSSCEQQKK